MNLSEVRQEIAKIGVRAIDKDGKPVRLNPRFIVTMTDTTVTMHGGETFTLVEEE